MLIGPGTFGTVGFSLHRGGGYLSIKLPDGTNAVIIRPELAPQGQAHPKRFTRKWLPGLEPASRLAIKDGVKKKTA
jgi:hypothetical protein